jgi:hypothetical protein
MLGLAMLAGVAHGQANRRGCEVAVYWDGNFSGEVWRTGDDQASAGPHWTKQISSVVVISGIWDFYTEPGFRGEVITLPPGGYAAIGAHWNHKIVSFRCVRPSE